MSLSFTLRSCAPLCCALVWACSLAALPTRADLAAPPPPPTPAAAKKLFQRRCSLCHGADGRGDTDAGKTDKLKDLSKKAWQAAHTDAQIRSVIEDGVPNTRMKAYKEKLDAEEIDALIAFIRTLGK